MKKILGLIILTAFIISIMGSVSPGLKTIVTKYTGDHKYASTQLPLPPTLENKINLAGQDNRLNISSSDISYDIKSKEINFIK